MEIRRSAAVSRDGELHQSHRQAHSQGDRNGSHSARHRFLIGRDGARRRGVSALTFLLLLATNAFAFESRLFSPEGKPIAGAQISVVDQRSTARTDAEGRFTLVPDPQLPATLIVVGSRGELYPPIHLPQLVAEIRLDPAYRETVTVTTGATPNIEGTPASAPVVYGDRKSVV